LATGVVVTLAMLGGMVAQTPVEFASAAFGWRGAMLATGVLGIIIIVLMLILLEDQPKNYQPQVTQHIREIGFWKSIKMVMLNRYNWLCGLYTTLMNLPIFLLGTLWGSMYLMQVLHFSATQAANVDAMLFFGTLIGSPLVGLISDQIRRRVLPMIVGAIVALGLVFLIMYHANLSYPALIIAYFLLGFITSTQVLGYPVIAELNSPLLTGSALSICSLLIMASGFVSQPLFGWFMDLHWNHTMVNNIPIYSLENFRLAMWMMPVGFIISLILTFFIKETRGQLQFAE
jgi:sugar phosphate permease